MGTSTGVFTGGFLPHTALPLHVVRSCQHRSGNDKLYFCKWTNSALGLGTIWSMVQLFNLAMTV